MILRYQSYLKMMMMTNHLFFPQSLTKELHQSTIPSKKKLEENYVYEWIEGEKVYGDDVRNEILLSSKDKRDILSSSLTNLFETFFSKELKSYIIESTNLQGYNLSAEDFDKFLSIILFSTINKRSSQRDYWSTDPLLRSEIVASTLSRKKFEKIKKEIKYYK